METTSMTKAITAIITGVATVAATIWSIDIGWLSPEMTVTIGSVVTALMVWLVPNKVVDVA